MPEYKDTATRLREASKRNDLPTGIVALLSEAYAEIVDQERRLENVRNGFEGCCTTCEPVAILNQKLQRERDEARRIACKNEAEMNRMMFDNPKYADPAAIAEQRGWNCFHNSNNQENDNGEE
jgi:hypothetical protein